MRAALNTLCHELDRGEETDSEATSLGIIKEKVKQCADQSQSAFHKIGMEKMNLQCQIDELTRENFELKSKVEALEQGLNIGYNISKLK